MLEACLARGHRALLRTNAMRPMMKRAEDLLALRARFGEALAVRVSVDHYARELHESCRGARSWQPTIDGLRWLARHGFAIRVAGRTCWGEPETALRAGFARLFAEIGVPVDAEDPDALVLFPEMDETVDVPEITERCWGIPGVEPAGVMCARSRMYVRRRAAARP